MLVDAPGLGTLEFPDGMSHSAMADAIDRAIKTKGGAMALEGTNALQRGVIGAGKAVSDIGQGISQFFGGASKADVEDTRARDSALMNTTAGKVGNFAGNVGVAVPSMFIPGANTLVGASVMGGLLGGSQPVGEGESRGMNTALGTAGGLAGQYVGNKVAGAISNRLTNETADLAAQKGQNAVRDETLAKAKEAGYVLPPSAVNPTFVGNRLESLAGKAAIGQEAAARNQQTTNSLARKALGLPEDAPLSERTLDQLRDGAAQPYRDVVSLTADTPLSKAPFKNPADTLKELRETRAEANSYWKHYGVSADPKSQAKAIALSQKSDLLEQHLEAVAMQAGKPDLVNSLREARTLIAKSYDVERALNLGSGDVSAKVLGRALDKGKPLSGDLETIARFAESFPAYAKDGASIPTPGVSKSEALASALLALGGHAATGNPLGMAAGLLPLASGPVRSGLLSGPAQRSMVKAPNYTPGAAFTLPAHLNPLLRNSLAPSGGAGLLGYAGQ